MLHPAVAWKRVLSLNKKVLSKCNNCTHEPPGGRGQSKRCSRASGQRERCKTHNASPLCWQSCLDAQWVGMPQSQAFPLVLGILLSIPVLRSGRTRATTLPAAWRRACGEAATLNWMTSASLTPLTSRAWALALRKTRLRLGAPALPFLFRCTCGDGCKSAKSTYSTHNTYIARSTHRTHSHAPLPTLQQAVPAIPGMPRTAFCLR